jgi:hypothetical protein
VHSPPANGKQGPMPEEMSYTILTNKKQGNLDKVHGANIILLFSFVYFLGVTLKAKKPCPSFFMVMRLLLDREELAFSCFIYEIKTKTKKKIQTRKA